VGFKIPQKSILVTIGSIEDKIDLFPALEMLYRKGFSFFATQHTHEFLKSRGIPSALLHKVSEPRSPNIREYLEKKRVELVVDIPTHSSSVQQTDGYFIRRIATDHGIPLITNVQLAKRLIEALIQIQRPEDLPLLEWPTRLAR
jgi:carbamoyl-phosphate synthase large subunit